MENINKLVYGQLYSNDRYPNEKCLYLGFKDTRCYGGQRHFIAVMGNKKIRVLYFYSHSINGDLLKIPNPKPARLKKCEREFAEQLLEKKLAKTK